MKSENRAYVARYSYKLSMEHGGQRFVMIDTKTGRVVDNAQGYGYKSAQNAYAAWHYKIKLNQPEQDNNAEADAMRQTIRDWLDDHEEVDTELHDLYLYAARTHNKVTVEDIYDILDQAEVDVDELPFQLEDLMKYW